MHARASNHPSICTTHSHSRVRAHTHTAQAGRGGTCAHPGSRVRDSDYPSRFEADAESLRD